MELAVAIADDAGFEAESLGRRLHFDGRGRGPRPGAGRADPAGLRQRDPQRAQSHRPGGGDVEVQATTGEGGFRLRGGRPRPRRAEADRRRSSSPFHRGGNGHASGGFGLWAGHRPAGGGATAGASARSIGPVAGSASRFLPLPLLQCGKGWPAGPAKLLECAPWRVPALQRGGTWSGRKAAATAVPCKCRGQARHLIRKWRPSWRPFHFCAAAGGDCCRRVSARRRPEPDRIPPWLIKYLPASGACAASETLVGQEHVVRALTHALSTGRLHHAYLFTGTAVGQDHHLAHPR